MKLLSLELNGFRGFPRRQEFDFNANAVIVVGANGNGKTSLFDGILWALSGQIPRLSTSDSELVSMYSETGQARTHLRLLNSDNGTEIIVTRSCDGGDTRVMVETPDGSYHGPSAEAYILDLIWRDAASAANSQRALAGVLTRSVYLQQDVVREFVEADSDEERFQAVSELVGAGRVTELQASLERAKKAWSTVTNQRQDELRPLNERLSAIAARLAELRIHETQSQLSVTSDAWTGWWNSLDDVGIQPIQVEFSSVEAPGVIDRVINDLNVKKRAAERRFEQLSSLQADLAEFTQGTTTDLTSVIQAVERNKRELNDLNALVVTEQERLSSLRSQQAATREKSEQLRTLAILALENLGDHCPVCAQTYDHDKTERRLQEIAAVSLEQQESPIDSSTLTQLLAQVASKESEVATAELNLRSSERAAREREARQATIDKRMRELEIQVSRTPSEALDHAIEQTQTEIRRLLDLQQAGEALSLQLSRSSAQALSKELEKEAQILRKKITDGEEQIASRNRTGDLAQKVIESLRHASSSVVQERLNDISPLLQSIYSRIDPHPSFRVVRFLSRIVRGRGQLSTIVSDPVENKESAFPSVVLSSSQLNALAVAVFLALNIGVPQPPLPIAMLDDPLQSLDDINLLGLVDLLRRTKAQRQLLVSTHDSRFGNLLARKLRPTRAGERTTVIELEGWSRTGPTVRAHNVTSDPAPLRLVAS
jgi:DNA repair exonuclease SbcCD ATPase subunit